jgi:cold shock CspA family protein
MGTDFLVLMLLLLGSELSVANLDQVGSGSGVVRYFDRQARYGFIIPDDGGGDVFVAGSILDAYPQTGDRVGYHYRLHGNIKVATSLWLKGHAR